MVTFIAGCSLLIHGDLEPLKHGGAEKFQGEVVDFQTVRSSLLPPMEERGQPGLLSSTTPLKLIIQRAKIKSECKNKPGFALPTPKKKIHACA